MLTGLVKKMSIIPIDIIYCRLAPESVGINGEPEI